MMGFGDEEDLPPTCSRAGCLQAAQWKVNWRNPRIHPKERVKIWLACDEHRDYLRDYLSNRGFPVIVTALAESVERVPDAPAGTL
jgi:hypothetical protein